MVRTLDKCRVVLYTMIQPLNLDAAYPPVKETVPASARGYHTNNKYDGVPPLMSDGRAIQAASQPLDVLNKQWVARSGAQTNWEYRRYLTANAMDIMRQNYLDTSNDCGYVARPVDLETHGTPAVFSSVEDNRRPKGYETSDLKDLYLSREQLNARMVAPEITQDRLIQMR